ncbi:MAG TPA: UDP-N-acetylmuramoyl-tripeptide--D-alanyl-D-alanine ligase [Gemmatimonadaceae bacterium]
MSFWTLDQVAAALREVTTGAVPRGREPLAGIATDTRQLVAGSVFVALKGERFDAHDFLCDAVERGAAALVVSNPARAAGLGRPVFAVRDTGEALAALGSWRRRLWGGTVVAVAGSNGKTTTKELIRAALAGAFEVYATQGNLNNLVGVPLTLLAIPDAAHIAVVEIGTSLPGEVDTLRRVSTPDVAVVTSIGEEHLEGLGDLAGVLREETSVYRDVPLAIAPAAQPEVGHAARTLAHQTVEAGLDAGDVRPDRWGVDGEGRGWAEFGELRLHLSVRGVHNLRNAMLAMAVARACGVAPEVAVKGIAGVQPLNMRGAWRALGSLTLINDAYNANPASMREAVALLDALDTTRPRVLVLGSMRELGPRSAALHDDVAALALRSRAALIAGIGDIAAPLRERADGRDDRVIAAPDVEELWPLLEARLPRDAIVLLKASRGVRLERLVPYLEAWAGGS